MRSLLRLFRTIATPDQMVADGELLRRYVESRDEAAFELLVYRHGPMVYAACRKLLRDQAEAEDAFQATFLALVRHAAAIRRRDAVAAWLHRTAYNAATLLLRRRVTAQSVEGCELAAVTTGALEDHEERTQAVRILHEEILKLPTNYRSVVVLCDLEQRPHAEAASQLGRPVGTVSGWLSKARKQLRTQLERRGVTSPAALAGLATASLGGTAPLSAAVAVGRNESVRIAVAGLAAEVIAAMRPSPVRALALAVGVVALTGGAVALAAFGSPAPLVEPRPLVQAPDPPKRDDRRVFEDDVIPEMVAHLRTIAVGNEASVRQIRHEITPARCTARFAIEHKSVENGKQVFAFEQVLQFKVHRKTGATRLDLLAHGQPPKPIDPTQPLKWQPLAFLGMPDWELKSRPAGLPAACRALQRLSEMDDATLHEAIHEARRLMYDRDASPEEIAGISRDVRERGIYFRWHAAEWPPHYAYYTELFIRPYHPQEAARRHFERTFAAGTWTDRQLDAVAPTFAVPDGKLMDWAACDTALRSVGDPLPRSRWAELSLDD